MTERIIKLKYLKNKGSIIACLLVYLCLMCLVSCTHKETYYRFVEIKEGVWHQQDVISFEIDSTQFELNTSYNISVEITNNNDYPYRNIWCFFEDNIDNDSIPQKTSMEFALADEVGKWNGSGFGALYQSSFDFKKQVIFKEKRNYTINILHGMRDEPLTGIEKVGIRIYREERN